MDKTTASVFAAVSTVPLAGSLLSLCWAVWQLNTVEMYTTYSLTLSLVALLLGLPGVFGNLVSIGFALPVVLEGRKGELPKHVTTTAKWVLGLYGVYHFAFLAILFFGRYFLPVQFEFPNY